MAKRVAKTSSQPPTESFEVQAEWERWLEANHAITDGIWIKFAKKSSGVVSINYREALDVALCFGWIDGQIKSIDASFYRQRFTPRRARSKWSKINCGHVERLIKAGKMRPAGLKQIESAKADGRWEMAYDSPRNAEPPDDLVKALRNSPKARKAFDGLSSQNRYAILWRIQNAKRPETRSKWVERCVTMLEAGQTFHP